MYKDYDLDAQLVDIMKGLNAALGNVPPLKERTVEQARRMLVERTKYYRSIGAKREENLEIQNEKIAGVIGPIPIRYYRPVGIGKTRLPLVLYFHGGAWMRGGLETHDDLAGRLASDIGCGVISVEYRLAPEYPFPAAIEDAYSALKWVFYHAEKLNIYQEKIAVAGDSSGGNLAAALAIKARDEEEYSIVFQVLLNPVLDLSSFSTQSYFDHGEKGFGLTKEKMVWARNLYLSDNTLQTHPYVSPIYVSNPYNLPPCIIVTSEYDPLRDEGQQYASKLNESGVETKYLCIPRVTHGIFDLVGALDSANMAMEEVAQQVSIFFERGKNEGVNRG